MGHPTGMGPESDHPQEREEIMSYPETLKVGLPRKSRRSKKLKMSRGSVTSPAMPMSPEVPISPAQHPLTRPQDFPTYGSMKSNVAWGDVGAKRQEESVKVGGFDAGETVYC